MARDSLPPRTRAESEEKPLAGRGPAPGLRWVVEHKEAAVLGGAYSPLRQSGETIYLLEAASRLLKRSLAFGDEARVVAVMDEEVSNEAPGSAEGCPAASASVRIVVRAFPGEFRAGCAIA